MVVLHVYIINERPLVGRVVLSVLRYEDDLLMVRVASVDCPADVLSVVCGARHVGLCGDVVGHGLGAGVVSGGVAVGHSYVCHGNCWQGRWGGPRQASTAADRAGGCPWLVTVPRHA